MHVMLLPLSPGDAGCHLTAHSPCCAACGKLLTAADLTPKAPAHPGGRRARNGGGVHGGSSGGSEAAAPRALLECAGCHRCFHGRCHQRWADQQQRTQQQHQQAQQQRQPRGWWLWGRGRRRGQGAPHEPAESASPAPAAAAARKAWDEEDADWFHSAECWQIYRALQRLCRAGRTPCDPAPCRPRPDLVPPGTRQSPDGAPGEPPISCSRSSSSSPPQTTPAASAVANASSAVAPAGGASAANTAAAAAAGGGDGDVDDLAVRLYDCRDLGPATAAGLRRVHSVVRQHFGYVLADFRDFDYAVLLTKGPSAVSAAIVDVYGSDLAELYLVATSTAMQRRGYGTALVRHLERALGGAGVRQLLVSVDDDDDDNQRLWRDKFGFRPLTASELGHLGRSFGAFGPSAVAGTVFLARRLGPPPGAAALGNAAAAGRC